MSRPLDQALDRLGGGGTATVDREAGRAEVEVVDVDRLGVKVRGIKVVRSRSVDVGDEARALPERLKTLPERVEPVEIAPELGGARLRTRPGDVGDGFFEVDVGTDETTLRRTRVRGGERSPEDFTLTRDQLDRLIDELHGPPVKGG